MSFIVNNITPLNIINNQEIIQETYKKYGVCIMPGFLSNDNNFLSYKNELNALLDQICSKKSPNSLPDEIGDKLVEFLKICPEDGKIVTDLGTQPNKFSSFNRIKYSDYLDEIIKLLFGPSSLITSPAAGDTLHFFGPGKSFRRFNLPPHQDYPYLMQSPSQITCYMGISEYKKDVGGLKFWSKSNELGTLPCEKNEHEAFCVSNYEELLKPYEEYDFHWNPGDFGIFDSLLVHSSIPNFSENSGRIVQIFRFSDINNDVSRDYDFQSTHYKRRSISFSEHHNELLNK